MTMQSVDVPGLKELIKHVVFEEHEPLMVVGPSGGGKSEAIRQAAEEAGAFLCTIMLGQYDTVDLKGTPWVRTRETYQDTVWHPASTLPFKGNPAFPTDRPILLFFDEATSATIPVAGILYQATLEHRVGEHEFMDNVFIVLAGNRTSDKGIVNRMPAPLTNRLTFCELVPSLEAWSKWATKAGMKPECVAFMNWKKEHFHNFDPAKPEFVFSTARSLTKAFLKYYASTTMPRRVKEAAMAGSIGGGVTTEFWGFIEHWQSVSTLIPAVLKDPAGVAIPEKLDIQYALVCNLSGLMQGGAQDNTVNINKFLFRLPDDFTVLAWNLACARDPNIFDAKGFVPYSKKCIEVLAS